MWSVDSYKLGIGILLAIIDVQTSATDCQTSLKDNIQINESEVLNLHLFNCGF